VVVVNPGPETLGGSRRNRYVALAILVFGVAAIAGAFEALLFLVILTVAVVWIALFLIGGVWFADPRYPYDASVHDRANQ
jgi:hypothetical protein